MQLERSLSDDKSPWLRVTLSRRSLFCLMADAEGVGYVHCGDGVRWCPYRRRCAAGDGVFAGVCRDPDAGERSRRRRVARKANRELQEELGWRAERIELLAELHPFKYLDSRQLLFLAQGLVPSRRQGDERHPVRAQHVPLDRWPELCTRGELQDALAIAALGLVERHLAASGETPPKGPIS